jgi:hypothetical protein
MALFLLSGLAGLLAAPCCTFDDVEGEPVQGVSALFAGAGLRFPVGFTPSSPNR